MEFEEKTFLEQISAMASLESVEFYADEFIEYLIFM